MKRVLKKTIVAILFLSLFATLCSGIALADSVYAFDDRVFIRSEPRNTGEVLGSMAQGTYASYLDESTRDAYGNVWYHVSYLNTRGWVSGKYTELRDGNSSSGYQDINPSVFGGWPHVDIIDYPSAERVVARNGKSFIRSGPSTDADDLGSLPKDAIAAYLGLCCTDMNGREWYRIDYNGIVGWVSARYTVIE